LPAFFKSVELDISDSAIIAPVAKKLIADYPTPNVLANACSFVPDRRDGRGARRRPQRPVVQVATGLLLLRSGTYT
jgi:hypothetical protein